MEVVKFRSFKNFEKNKNKKQIILCNSFRNGQDYINSLKYRKNGRYDRVPNYLITREGKVLNLLADDCYTNFFDDYEVNKNSIIISLENLGWLIKAPLQEDYFNWIGEKTTFNVYERKWREKIYWQTYTEEQINSLSVLCKKLLKKFSIKKSFIGHNTKVDGIKIFNGIVCRSNYNNKFTDPSPSFNFEYFKNIIENESN